MAHQKNERTRKKKTRPAPGRTNPDAAGIDLGATVPYVAVPADRDENPVRYYGTLTEDLIELADWLKQCRITTVAMEATGVYWIPLFQEERGGNRQSPAGRLAQGASLHPAPVAGSVALSPEPDGRL